MMELSSSAPASMRAGNLPIPSKAMSLDLLNFKKIAFDYSGTGSAGYMELHGRSGLVEGIFMRGIFRDLESCRSMTLCKTGAS